MSQSMRDKLGIRSILHKDFRYIPSGQTDITKTIKREQKRLAALKVDTERVVKPLIRVKI